MRKLNLLAFGVVFVGLSLLVACGCLAFPVTVMKHSERPKCRMPFSLTWGAKGARTTFQKASIACAAGAEVQSDGSRITPTPW